MKWSVIVLLGVAAVSSAVPALAQANFPRMTKTDPAFALVGETVTVSGDNLTKKDVEQVFLTDGKNDIQVSVIEQTQNAIKFKVPEAAKPHRFTLMVLTGGADKKLIEQPCKLTVESDTERKARLEQDAERSKDAEPAKPPSQP